MAGKLARLIAVAGLVSSTLASTTNATNATNATYVFKSEDAASFQNSHIPTLVNLTESQYDKETGSSWWMSSFITSTLGKQYFAIGHILTANKNVCRSSVLDLATLEYWVDLTYCSNGSAFDRSGPLDGRFDTYGVVSTSSDSISKMNLYANTNASFAFDVTWEATSKILLNGGSGSIGFGAGPTNATEWGIPAAKTSGSLEVESKNITIDPENSFTWYDRQLSYGAPRNWTWFQLHFPGSQIKASIWAQDFGPPDNTTYQFGTVRFGESQAVLAYDLIPDMSNTWTSPNTGLVYPLKWRLEFDNGDYLVIKSVRADQEMYGPEDLVDSAYEGFITATGKFFGQDDGFGVVELVTSY